MDDPAASVDPDVEAPADADEVYGRAACELA